MRDTFVSCGVLSETFETAITWDRFEEFHRNVIEATSEAVAEVTGAPTEGEGAPRVSCRLTHVYPDGAAPYFTVIAPAIRGGEVEQWDEIKAAASEAIDRERRHDHPPSRGRPRPPPLVRPAAPRPRSPSALGAAKGAVDPDNLLNPGVLID